MLYSHRLLERLRNEIVGQDLALREMVRAITLARADLSVRHRPLGAYLFLGPTGTGKSALSSAVAKELFGREDLVIPVHLGSALGTVNLIESLGYHVERCGGLITETDADGRNVRYCQAVVVVDDLQDMSAEGMATICHILDDGLIQLGGGETFDFSRALFIFKSSLCADRIDELNRSAIGFHHGADVDENDEIDDKIYEVARKCIETDMPAEFVGRLDRVVVFKRLKVDQLPVMLDRALARISDMLVGEGPPVTITIQEDLRSLLLEKGKRRLHLGARPLMRNIRKYVQFPIADLAVSGAIQPGAHVTLGVEDGRSYASVEPAEASPIRIVAL